MEIDKYLSFLESFTGEDLPRYLYFLVDEKGAILKFFPNENYRAIAEELSAAGNISAFYPFSQQNLPADWKSHTSLLPSINFKYFETDDEFFTRLPVTAVRFRKAGPSLYLARISFHDIIPNTIASRRTSFFYADIHSDALLGFNRTFYYAFGAALGPPAKLLGMPVSTLFTPSPLEARRNALPAFGPPKADSFETAYGKDFASDEVGNLEEWRSVETARRPGIGLEIKNPGPGAGYLTLLKPFDSRACDFFLTLTVESGTGGLPLFILGGRHRGADLLPDSYGYLAGRSAGKHHWTLKRNGQIAWSAPAENPPPEAGVFHFCKTGNTLSLFQGEEEILAFPDPDFLHHADAFFSLQFQPGSSALICELRLQIRPAAPAAGAPGEGGLVVKSRGTKEAYFSLERFYNNVLSTQEILFNTAGYFVHDVSEIEGRATALNQKYKSEVRTKRKLEGLLNHYRDVSQGGTLAGNGAAMRALREKAEAVAASNATILIQGPTGAGKEVLARHIHDKSPRESGPFIKVDCATIPQNLLESQLFGYEKGAFTGAHARFIGLCEQADGGTLFLDEIGNLSLDTQTRFLQFLNDFTITRIGGSATLRLNLRCIAASNRTLREMVRDGEFRDDLYYRLSVVEIRVPALSERKEDIRELCGHFLTHYNSIHGKKIKGFSEAVLSKLESYGWPGNVRELRNQVERAVLFAPGEEIGEGLVDFESAGKAAPRRRLRRPSSPRRLHLTPREQVVELMKKHLGKVSAVVRELGTSNGAFYYYLKQKEIRAEDYRQGFLS